MSVRGVDDVSGVRRHPVLVPPGKPAMPTNMHLLAFIAGGLFLWGPSPAVADRPAVPFDVEAQPLIDAVFAWSRQSGVRVSWRPESSASQRWAPRVTGRLSPEQALSQLLAGSELTFHFANNRVHIYSMSAATAKEKHPSGPPSGASSSGAILEEVHVTGTNILGVEPAGSQMISFDIEDILRRGYTTTEEFLRSLPQNVRSGVYGESADARLSAGSGASGNVSFGSAPNLRGLGAPSSLVLINGHRMARSGRGFLTDVSLIPLHAIARIEMVLEGASAIYGADAVAGVVNIILKEDYRDLESRIDYGFTQPSGLQQVQASQALGTAWAGGGILAIANYLDQSELSVEERRATRNVAQPASIFPSNEQIGVLLTSQQAFSEALSLKGDLLYGHARRQAVGAAPAGHFEFPAEIGRLDAALALEGHLSQRWVVTLQGNVSREGTDFSFVHVPNDPSVPSQDTSEVQNLRQEQWSVAVLANARLGSVPAGVIGLASGAEHREEHYTHRLLSPQATRLLAGRTINSVSLEMHAPLIGAANAIPGVSAMSATLAARYDEYSDFGGITNPKLGFSWSIVPSVEVRASYSHSFRPAATGAELLSRSRGTNSTVQIYSFTTASREGTRPVAFLTGSHELRPEQARHWSAGVFVRPTDELQFGAMYYDISYYDRIVRPPLDQDAMSNPSLQSFLHHYQSPELLHAALAREIPTNLTYADRTGPDFEPGAFGPDPLGTATDLFDARLVNAGLVHTSGMDVTINYAHEFAMGRGWLSLDANDIRAIDTVFAPGAPAFDSVDIAGEPARFRVRATAGFARGAWEAALTANFTNGYTDPRAAADTSVDSHTTIDAGFKFTVSNRDRSMLNKLSVSLSAVNVLNEAPPSISGALSRGANYDATNADPRGRFILLQLAKPW